MSGENHKERLNRELIELLTELRVALLGVQVLFAFLLIVPFYQRFSSVTPLQRNVYFAVLLCAALSAALLIAPSSHHRLLWRQGAKEATLRAANRLSVLGLSFLALAMIGAIFLITDVLFGGVGSNRRHWRGVRMGLVRAAAASPGRLASSGECLIGELRTSEHPRGEVVRRTF
jgi:Family of unknown function (DUF6328)